MDVKLLTLILKELTEMIFCSADVILSLKDRLFTVQITLHQLMCVKIKLLCQF